MPIALDPSQTVDIVLKLEQGKENAPTFVARYLTYRETIKYKAIIKEAAAEADDEKANAKVVEAFKLAIVGWKNISTPFSHDAWMDVLTPSEYWELVYSISNALQLSEDQKKRSLSKSATDTAKDANT